MTHGAGRQARGQIRRALKKERAAWRQHAGWATRHIGKCTSECEAQQRWNVAHEILIELLEKCGGRPTPAEKAWN